MKSTEEVDLIGQKIIVIDEDPVKESKGGIAIPDTAQNKSLEGRIIAIGDGQEETTFTGKWPPFDLGQKVLFGRYAGTETQIEDTGEKIRILGIQEVLGVVRSKRGSKNRKEQ